MPQSWSVSLRHKVTQTLQLLSIGVLIVSPLAFAQTDALSIDFNEVTANPDPAEATEPTEPAEPVIDRTIPTDPLFNLDNAWNQISDPAPAHRPIAAHEFETRVGNGSILLTRPETTAEAEAGERRRTSTLEARARDLFKNDRASLLEGVLNAPSGWSTAVQIKDQKGQNQTVRFLGRDQILRDWLSAFDEARSLDNQKLLYQSLQRRLEGVPNLPAVDLNKIDVDELRVVNTQLISALEARLGRDTYEGRVPSSYGQCENEEGASFDESTIEGDQTGEVCTASPQGLLKNSDWTLKFANTCVRNQGVRSTGASFATTAALESLIARDRRRFSNLSEQHLISQQTLRWTPQFADLVFGPDFFMTNGLAKAIGYSFHFEDSWRYNPSYPLAQLNDLETTDFDSCGGYQGRYCSHTAHQGRRLCTEVGPLRFCGYDAPMPLATPYTIAGVAKILDPLNPDTSVALTRALVRAGTPIVLEFAVPSQFAAIDAHGYVGAPNAEDRILGAHTLLITGWVANSRRPAQAPEATGGGYFVAKNSWGSCTGDAGYVYLPAAFVRTYALNLVAVF